MWAANAMVVSSVLAVSLICQKAAQYYLMVKIFMMFPYLVVWPFKFGSGCIDDSLGVVRRHLD